MKNFRAYHALFALVVVAGYLTAEELGLIHSWLGYVVASMLALRLLLGLARRRGFAFARLLPRPAGERQKRMAVGQALNLALLATVLSVAGTGIAMDRGGTLVGNGIRLDGKEREGGDDVAMPSTLLGFVTTAQAGNEEDEAEESPLGEVHETLGNLLLPLALAHVLYLLVFRFDMARFMLFAARKRA